MSRLQTSQHGAEYDDGNGAQAPPEFAELMQQPLQLDNSAVAAITRAETDIQIVTAKKYPRSVHQAKQLALTMATIDIETAAACFYKLPRDGKTIEGPSVRLAEIFASAWGNLSFAARVIDETDKFIVAQGICHDLQFNVRTSIEVRRRITTKYGKKYGDDMISVTANAACSIALRNAIFRVIPKCYIQSVYEAAKKVAVGDAKTLPQRRHDLLTHLQSKIGIDLERILAVVNRKTIEDIDLNDLELLFGLATAIRDGDATIDEAFPLPAKTAEPKEEHSGDKASKLAQSIGQTSGKPVDPQNHAPPAGTYPTPSNPASTPATPPQHTVATTTQEPPTDPIKDALDVSWEDAKRVYLNAAKESSGVGRSDLEGALWKWTKKLGLTGKEDKIVIDDRVALYRAILEKRFDFKTGEIKSEQ